MKIEKNYILLNKKSMLFIEHDSMRRQFKSNENWKFKNFMKKMEIIYSKINRKNYKKLIFVHTVNFTEKLLRYLDDLAEYFLFVVQILSNRKLKYPILIDFIDFYWSKFWGFFLFLKYFFEIVVTDPL